MGSEQPVNYKDGAQALSGFVVKPAKPLKGKPGILILPAWMGIDEHAKNTALKLAESGYMAFTADIYGVGNYPKSPQEAGPLSTKYKTDYKTYQQRIKLALDELIKAGAAADKIVIIGFCFGGTGALEAARANMPVKGVVSFHGGLGKAADRITTSVGPKVLVCHGADDFFVPQPEIDGFQKEMKGAKADWQMIYYPNAVHSFTDPAAGNDNSKGAAYNASAAKRSWEHMMVFLKEIL
ncbi:MAG: dienelactone hydrolase family protein [Sphingobacteriales bacterium]|nr:MAG: dienelactone hydrolase family protein [Sphingobacteriales bacterium]